MKAIYKYQIHGPGSVVIEMPRGAILLHAREQNDTACIWAQVDPSEPPEYRRVFAVETGMTIVPDGGRYLGTAIMINGRYVLHIFEPAN